VVCRKTRRQFGVSLGVKYATKQFVSKPLLKIEWILVLPHFSHAPILVQPIVPSQLTSGVKAHLSLRGDNFT